MRKNFVLCLVISVLIFLPSVQADDVKPNYGGTIYFGRGNDSLDLDPALLTDGESGKVVLQVMEGLVRFKKGSTEVEPCLATSWKTSSDGLTWIFYLRQGVKFHDGTDFNADSVIFSFERQIKKDHPYRPERTIYWDAIYNNIKKVNKIDNFTVEVMLDKPYAPLLSNLAIFTATIISPEAMKKKGVEKFSREPVGTAPFKFVRWKPNDKIILEANKNYWGGRPYLDKVIYTVIKDNIARRRQLERGKIHIMDGLDPDNYVSIARNPQLKIIEVPGINVGYLAMNCQKPPFNDRRVRQAINLAINKRPIIKFLYQDIAIPAKNPIPPSLWGYNDDVEDYAYDPVKARELLSLAGYPDGFKTSLDVMENPRSYMPEPQEVAIAIKDNLAAIGIEVDLVFNQWKTHLEKSREGAHSMVLLGWIGDNGDPDNFIYFLLDKDNTVKGKAQNVAFYANDDLHDILVKAQQSFNLAERVSLYRKAQEIIHVDAPWVPLAHTKEFIAVNKKLKGANLQSIMAFINLKDVWLER